MIGGRMKSAKTFSKLFSNELKNKSTREHKESEMEMFDRIIKESDEIYNRRYERVGISARHFDEKNFNVDDVILESVKSDMKGAVEGISGGADIKCMVENILEGGALIQDDSVKEVVEEYKIKCTDEEDNGDSDSDELGIPPAETDILNIIDDGAAVITGGNSKMIENILVDEKDEKEKDEEREPVMDILENKPPEDSAEREPVMDILEKKSDRDAIMDILENKPTEDDTEREPVMDIMEKSIIEMNNQAEDVREPVADILEKKPVKDTIYGESSSSSSSTSEDEFEKDGFYSDYSESDSDEIELVTAPKYLELIHAIRDTQRKLSMKGGSKNNSGTVRVIDSFPWIMDDSDSD